MRPTLYGCPLCEFRSRDEEEVVEHMIDMGDDPMHEDFEEFELTDKELDAPQAWNQVL